MGAIRYWFSMRLMDVKGNRFATNRFNTLILPSKHANNRFNCARSGWALSSSGYSISSSSSISTLLCATSIQLYLGCYPEPDALATLSSANFTLDSRKIVVHHTHLDLTDFFLFVIRSQNLIAFPQDDNSRHVSYVGQSSYQLDLPLIRYALRAG